MSTQERRSVHILEPLRIPWVYHFFLFLLKLSIRVPLRLILGKEKRNEILKDDRFYRRLTKIEARYKWGEEDHEFHWGFIDPAGKTILDIGADWGSTAEFFMMKKAKSIIAVESDKQLYRQLVRNSKKVDSITPIFLFVNSSRHFEILIKTFKPDILKIDCEGCEIHLKDVDPAIFSKVKEYAIEIHDKDTIKIIKKKLASNEYRLLNQFIVWSGITVLFAIRS